MESDSDIKYTSIVLSGASTKGLLTLGALQYVYDKKMCKDVRTYIGTSSGAMIGYLLAIGYTPTEIIVYLCTSQILERVIHFNLVAMINGDGATSWTPIQEVLEKMTIDKVGKFLTMGDIKKDYQKTLICTAYNYTESKVEYISSENAPNLPCLVALRMSANLPLLFPKFTYMGNLYIDGGITDNFPIDLIDQEDEKVFGCLIQTSSEHSNDESILEFIYKLMYVPIHQAVEHKIKRCAKATFDIIRLSFPKLKFFNFNIPSSVKLEMFSLGYRTAKEYYSTKDEPVEKSV